MNYVTLNGGCNYTKKIRKEYIRGSSGMNPGYRTEKGCIVPFPFLGHIVRRDRYHVIKEIRQSEVGEDQKIHWADNRSITINLRY